MFHLYRGSALLEENRAAEAKEELERALEFKPRDSEGQGLLGVVYFRLGLYPRAIAIYLDLVREWPDAITPKLNLALCYLKTGQPAAARELLEDVLRRVPDHARAWGYLGLAFERLSRLDEAAAAFDRAGQPRLAARVRRLRDITSDPPSDPGAREALRLAARDASLEIDGGPEGVPFLRDEPARSDSMQPERWSSFELGREPMPGVRRSKPPAGSTHPAPIPELERDPVEQPPLSVRSQDFDLVRGTPLTSFGLAGMHLVEVPPSPAERTSDGLVVLRAEEGFSLRRERLRALSQDSALDPVSLRRRVRSRETEEPFASPHGGFARIQGKGFAVLEPPADRDLIVIQLGDELLYVRESRLVAFHGNVQYENGRLPVSDSAPVAIVQLKGRGAIVIEASRRLSALGVSADRVVTVRAGTVLGWSGRVVGQPPEKDQAPLWMSGAVAFSGDGTVFVDDP